VKAHIKKSKKCNLIDDDDHNNNTNNMRSMFLLIIIVVIIKPVACDWLLAAVKDFSKFFLY
jgi:hypothetical protein